MFSSIKSKIAFLVGVKAIHRIPYISEIRGFCEYYTMADEKEIIYVAFPDRPAYFVSQTQSTASPQHGTGDDDERSKYMKSKLLAMFIFDKPGSGTKHDILKDYIESEISAQKIVRSKLPSGSGTALCAQFSRNLYYAGKRGHIKRGVFFYSTDTDSVPTVEFIKDTAQANGMKTFSKFIPSLSHGRNIKRLIIDAQTGEIVKEIEYIHFQYPTFGNETEKRISPIFSVPDFTPVLHGYKEAIRVLRLIDLPEIKELLEITNKHIEQTPNPKDEMTIREHPFVVVEGMDGTGKTTITQLLTEKLYARRFFTPPPQIQHLRTYFDALPEIVRRAYYCVGNYIVAKEITSVIKEQAVVMDRFWHSTAAYGIAKETSSGDMPDPSHSVYKWPNDLLKPSLVLFLTVGEDLRKQRMTYRGAVATVEELQLEGDQLFRERLCKSYRRMADPACVEIDTSAPVDDVLHLAIEQLKAHGINIPLHGPK